LESWATDGTVAGVVLTLVALYWAYVASMGVAIAAARVDSKTSLIPNTYPIAIALIWICGIVSRWAVVQGSAVWYDALFVADPIIGASPAEGAVTAIVCLIVLLAITVIYERIRGRFGMGGGDIKLIAALALFVGFRGIVVTVIVACIVYAVLSLARRRKADSPSPFGPFIVGGYIVFVAVSLIAAF
jgi:prepilin signal peptidase PulO-like enzyme (type II secretory pathway)